MAKTGINALFELIDDLEKQVRIKYPKQRGRVMIANAKQIADYEVGKDDVMLWAHTYQKELKKHL